jgi:hypothetical protein
VLGPLPADAETLQGLADGLPAEKARRPTALETDAGDQRQAPQTGGLAQGAGRLVQQGLERLGTLGAQQGFDGRRSGRLFAQTVRAFVVEGVDDVADRRRSAAEIAGDLLRRLPLGTGQEDLAAPQGKRIGRMQAGLKLPPLGVGQWSNKQRWFHACIVRAKVALNKTSIEVALDRRRHRYGG